MRLHPEPFRAVASGRKTIEARLFDQKRQQIQVGDRLTLISRANPTETVEAQVVALLRADSFEALLGLASPADFGSEGEHLVDQVGEFYSLEQQHEYGVIGINFRIV